MSYVYIKVASILFKSLYRISSLLFAELKLVCLVTFCFDQQINFFCKYVADCGTLNGKVNALSIPQQGKNINVRSICVQICPSDCKVQRVRNDLWDSTGQ
jgi:hypothetical protein